MRMEGVEGPGGLRRSPKLPVQDLEVYERNGGHTLARHVNTSPADDLRRVASGRVSGAGSFLDRATAQRALEKALDQRRDDVRAWLRGPYRNAPFTLIENVREVIGRSISVADLERGVVVPRPVTAVMVVLRASKHLPGGFTVRTAFPTRARRVSH